MVSIRRYEKQKRQKGRPFEGTKSCSGASAGQWFRRLNLPDSDGPVIRDPTNDVSSLCIKVAMNTA